MAILQPLIEATLTQTERPKKDAAADAAADADTADSASSEPPKSYKNIFDVLEAYEPSQAFLDAPDVSPSPKPSTGIEYTAEPDTSFAEALFAFTSLLLQYRNLRLEINNLWAEWLGNELDLGAVSVATNMAFELAQSMENEIKPLLDAHGGIPAILPQYVNIVCDINGIDGANKERRTDRYNLEAYELAKTCLANTLALLNGYKIANGGDTVVTTYNGKFGWYDEKLDSNAETNRGKLEQDRAALMEILPDLQFLASNLGRGAVEDELIRGVGKLMDVRTEVNSCPMWLAFAFQAYLDILQNMGEICDEGHEEMRQASIRAQVSMVHVPKSPERQKVLRAAKKWDTDPIKTSRDYMVALGLIPDRDIQAFKTLDRNPLYCGLIIHNIRCTMHYQGVTYAATPSAIMCVTQPYYALRQEGLLPEDLVWEDLETFISMQGSETFFIGNQPPTDSEGHYKNFGLSLGISTNNWAPSKRKNKKVNIHAGNRRNMKFMGFTSLKTNYSIVPSAGDQPPSAAEVIQHVLESGRRHALLDGKGHVRPGMKAKAPEAA